MRNSNVRRYLVPDFNHIDKACGKYGEVFLYIISYSMCSNAPVLAKRNSLTL